MSLILIIDDDRQLCLSFSKILSQDGYSTATAYSGREGLEQTKALQPDLVILDIRLPDMSGIEVFDRIHALFPKLPVIIITAFSTTETAIGAIQKGAYDYIYKPFDVPEMLKLVEKAVDAGRYMSTSVAVNPELDALSDQEALVGTSNLMLDVYKSIGRVTSTDATVLIRGESGTGKELASRAVYNHSLRVDKPYIVINCVAIPETLLESELFGYEKGAFTGALYRKIGKIEQAQGGTVFLDEIGDMPLTTQAKFLRLLQEKTIERIGGKGPITVDVRIIAATNRDLESAVVEGTFREDLYYRLRVVTITMPPLRRRKEDIPLLCHYLMAKLAKEMAMDNPGITEEALQKIYLYDWPGNIREMSNILKKTLIFNRGAPLLPEDIVLHELSQAQLEKDSKDEIASMRQWIRSSLVSNTKDKLYDSCLDHIASLLVEQALELCNGNRSKAAKLLGITRPTLHAKMEKYNIVCDFGSRKE
jgi:DNA-binding NtrC family response regulator